MNFIHGVNRFLPRLLAPTVVAVLGRFLVVVRTEARQIGKATLGGTGAIGEGRDFRTLDDYDVLERARTQPDTLLRGVDRLTLNEVQRAPELLLAIKREVDGSGSQAASC